MSIDYIVASLPPLAFDAPAPMSLETFAAAAPGADRIVAESGWRDLEAILRNAMAEGRGGAKYARPAEGCSPYWKNRVLACFAERDVAKRQDMLDRTWWDAAGELTPPASPLGPGALATYAVRLGIALRRSAASAARGTAAFDRLTAETRRPA